jgi:hypothetical protein
MDRPRLGQGMRSEIFSPPASLENLDIQPSPVLEMYVITPVLGMGGDSGSNCLLT